MALQIVVTVVTVIVTLAAVRALGWAWWKATQNHPKVSAMVGYATALATRQPPRTTIETARIAGHEAAHAVVAYAAGFDDIAISMVPSGASNARCYNRVYMAGAESQLVAQIAVCMAGRTWDLQSGYHDAVACQDDMGQAVNAALGLMSFSDKWTLNDALDAGAHQARQIVRDNQTAIMLIVGWLSYHNSLSPAELDNLIHRHLQVCGELVAQRNKARSALALSVVEFT